MPLQQQGADLQMIKLHLRVGSGISPHDISTGWITLDAPLSVGGGPTTIIFLAHNQGRRKALLSSFRVELTVIR